MLPLDELLHDHGEQAGVVVVVDQLVERVADVDLFPAAAVGVFEHTGQANIVYDGLPVHPFKVAQAVGVDDAGDVVFVGQGNGLGAGDAEPGGKGRLEELVVGGPHEGVVDDGCALENGVLEVGAVVGHLLGDAVYDDGVGAVRVHLGRADLDVLGDDAL